MILEIAAAAGVITEQNVKNSNSIVMFNAQFPG